MRDEGSTRKPHWRLTTGVCRLLGYELIRPREYPGAGDAEDVGVAGDVCRERGVRRGQAHDVQRRRVEYPLPRRAVDVDPLERAVGFDRDGHHQAAVDP